MTGKLKTRGNMMLATKLNDVLKVRPNRLFLEPVIDVAYFRICSCLGCERPESQVVNERASFLLS